MATITAQATDEDGIANLTLSSAASGGDVFANTGKQLVHIVNGDASSKTITFTGQATDIEVPGYGKMDQASVAAAVAAGNTAIFGPFPTRGFNNSSGQVAVTYSAVTSVTIAVISLP